VTFPPISLAAAVLTGGQSVRMGTDKANLPHPITGAPLLLRQLDLLRSLAPAELLVSARSGQSIPLLPADVTRVNDDGTSGPLGGIVATLRAISSTHLLVIAVDLPDLNRIPLDRLRVTLTADTGAIASTPDGLEPLIAIYPRQILPELTRAQLENRLSLSRLLKEPFLSTLMPSVPFDPAPIVFRNWNTP
jgi:molybdopterin-guanine dinucleotide biosynthesis protein A